VSEKKNKSKKKKKIKTKTNQHISFLINIKNKKSGGFKKRKRRFGGR
jgi:hypothetical protein